MSAARCPIATTTAEVALILPRRRRPHRLEGHLRIGWRVTALRAESGPGER